jgi:hypothetical protein
MLLVAKAALWLHSTLYRLTNGRGVDLGVVATVPP